MDKIHDKKIKATAADPIGTASNKNRIEKIPVINETIAEPSLSFAGLTAFDFCEILCVVKNTPPSSLCNIIHLNINLTL